MTEQSGKDEEWRLRDPYKSQTDSDEFHVEWRGACHCGKIQYQLSRETPLASKYCHCKDCRILHGAPFQWAAIFHKTDVRFTNGTEGLGWYQSSSRSTEHHLPCKVYCEYCRTPIMDEGRNMVLLFPTLIKGVVTEAGKGAFKPQCHIFYSQRVVEFRSDGLVKWEGLDGKSALLDDDGKRVGQV